MNYTRRDFGKTALAGLGLSMLPASTLWADAKADATVKGVKLGAITGAYGPFNAAPGQDIVDVVIRTSLDYGVGHVELVNSLIEPPMGGVCAQGRGGAPGAAPAGAPPAGGAPGGPGGPGGAGRNPCGVGGQVPNNKPDGYEAARDELRQWRINAPLDRFREIRKKFDAAGLDLYSYVMTVGDDFTEPEIEAVYKHMDALKVDKFCTNQTRVSMGKRMAPYSEKYKITAAWHTHAMSQDPNEISSPESLATVLAMSKYFAVNLDVGHYWDGGNDPLVYLKAHPDRITHLHVRDSSQDRKQMDIGTGVLHVDEMLKFVRDNKYPIAFIVEQVGRAGTADRNAGLKANIDWMKSVLSS